MKSGLVRRMRVELTRACAHYPLKVACLPFHHLRVVTCKSISNVPKTGLEPEHLTAHAPETCASTNSATWALNQNWYSCLNTNYWLLVERKTGFEPATPTLARSCSTTELFPHFFKRTLHIVPDCECKDRYNFLYCKRYSLFFCHKI